MLTWKITNSDKKTNGFISFLTKDKNNSFLDRIDYIVIGLEQIQFKYFLNMLEHQTPDFYGKETMGTTIMAVKYDGGVIACADTRNKCPYPRHIFRRLIHSGQSGGQDRLRAQPHRGAEKWNGSTVPERRP